MEIKPPVSKSKFFRGYRLVLFGDGNCPLEDWQPWYYALIRKGSASLKHIAEVLS